MKYSIIIPAYNSETYIHNALDSITEQSFKDYELIVVCDSCEDNTAQLARDAGAIVDEVSFHNDGLTRSRGLDLATGEWVLFMDDDDWWLHEFVLDRLNTKLSDNIDVLAFSFIFSGLKYADPFGNGGGLWPAVWNKCWRRSFIGDTRFPNVRAISDSYFHDEMMRKSPRLYTWDMPMYFYNYMRAGSISAGGM